MNSISKSKKYVLIILFIIVLLLAANFLIFNPYKFENTFTVGSSKFNMPEGYEKVSTDSGVVTISDGGKNKIFIDEADEKNINKYISKYEKRIASKNQTMTVENITMDNITLYKTNNIDNPGTIHYIFVKNKKVYDVYTWSGTKDLGSIALELAKS